jgi:hypothetical protein
MAAVENVHRLNLMEADDTSWSSLIGRALSEVFIKYPFGRRRRPALAKKERTETTRSVLARVQEDVATYPIFHSISGKADEQFGTALRHVFDLKAKHYGAV